MGNVVGNVGNMVGNGGNLVDNMGNMVGNVGKYGEPSSSKRRRFRCFSVYSSRPNIQEAGWMF